MLHSVQALSLIHICAGDILGRHKAEVVIHALENRIRAADGHDDDFERRGRGHVAELMVVNDALERAVFEIIGRLIEVGVVDDVHVLARDARHDFRRLQAETLKHEGGFRSRRSLGRSLDVEAALAVEVGAGAVSYTHLSAGREADSSFIRFAQAAVKHQ